MKTTELELRLLTSQGKKFTEIAEYLGVHVQNVRTTCSVLGIASGKKPKKEKRARPRVDVDGCLSDIALGMTLKDVAKKRGLSNSSAVYNALKRAGMPTNARAYLAQHASAQTH